MMNVLNGGKHADNSVDFQEFMIVPFGAPSFREALRMGVETFHALRKVLAKKGYNTAVGDEGGFAPSLKCNEEAIEVILAAIDQAGFTPGEHVALALDPAASEFFEDGRYVMHKSDKSRKTPEQIVRLFEDWVARYPIVSIEFGVAENDTDGWRLLTAALGESNTLRRYAGRGGRVHGTGFVTNGLIGLAAYLLLRAVTRLRRIDAATVAGYYGSDSAGTFVTCVAVLTTAGIQYQAYMPVMLAVMEIPGCLVALYLVSCLRRQGMDPAGTMPGEPGHDPNARPVLASGLGNGPSGQGGRVCEVPEAVEQEREMALEKRNRPGDGSRRDDARRARP
jgi:hypothetical protein